MAEEKKEAAPPAKEHKETAASGKKSGGAMGAVLAGVVLLAVGAGVGVAGASLVAKWSTSGEPKSAEDAAKAKEKEAHKAKEGEGHAGGLHGMHEVEIKEVKSNIKNQQGRRYVMFSCSLYFSDANALVLGFAGGGGHGGGEAGGNMKRIIQQTIEELIKNYDIEELTTNPYPTLKKSIRDSVNRSLSEVMFPGEDVHPLVERVVLYNLLVQ